MNYKMSITLIFVLFSLGCSSDQPENKNTQAEVMNLIQKSHIEANVLPTDLFDSCMQRDLSSYFSKEFNGNVTVDYQMLRDSPTQAGLSWPKYYVWVIIKKQGIIKGKGAARVAAINKERFEVFQFISAEDIENNSTQLNEYFPQSLHGKIKQLSQRDKS